MSWDVRIRIGYVWTQIFLYPHKKICRYKNLRIRVDGALVLYRLKHHQNAKENSNETVSKFFCLFYFSLYQDLVSKGAEICLLQSAPPDHLNQAESGCLHRNTEINYVTSRYFEQSGCSVRSARLFFVQFFFKRSLKGYSENCSVIANQNVWEKCVL